MAKPHMMKRNGSIITILIGVGLLLVSIFFSDTFSPLIKDSIAHRVIVLVSGDYLYDGHYKGRIEIPLKYALSLSVIIILIGTGVLVTSKGYKKGIETAASHENELGSVEPEER